MKGEKKKDYIVQNNLHGNFLLFLLSIHSRALGKDLLPGSEKNTKYSTAPSFMTAMCR